MSFVSVNHDEVRFQFAETNDNMSANIAKTFKE